MFNAQKIRTWLINYLHAQLFLSLVSLPIMIAWGLPISLLSFVGNVVFTPILMAFLMISALIFFSELLHIPNLMLIALLEKLTTTWYQITQIGATTKALIGFTTPPMFLVVAVPAITVFVMHWRPLKRVHHRTAIFATLFVCCLSYALLSSRLATAHIHTDFAGGSIVTMRNGGITTIIDPGVLARKASAPSWLEFTFLPELNKRCGTTTIDHLIVLQPSTRLFSTLAKLCKSTRVNHVYVPFWHATDESKKVARTFIELKKTCQETQTHLVRFASECTVEDLCITPLEKKITGNGITFAAFQVSKEQNVITQSQKYRS